jgi:hypothetical protein
MRRATIQSQGTWPSLNELLKVEHKEGALKDFLVAHWRLIELEGGIKQESV